MSKENKYTPSEEVLKECGFKLTKNTWTCQLPDKLEIVYTGNGNPFRLWEQEDYAHCIAIDNFLNIQSDADLKIFLKVITQNQTE